ncbi:uncharacterized protein [Epargyreus clarus]|uniref:uncharacterized protein n=1 Tax=Epargyreus clarus TaxID=520877 RepID=UPI003C30E493
MQPSISDHSVKIEKLVASNSFLDYVEEGESITERSHPSKGLFAQSTMMSKFNIDTMVRQHLDTGNYDDTSLTESSSEEQLAKPIFKDSKFGTGRRSNSSAYKSDDSFMSARRSTSPVIRSISPRPTGTFIDEKIVIPRRVVSQSPRNIPPRPTITSNVQKPYTPGLLNVPRLPSPVIVLPKPEHTFVAAEPYVPIAPRRSKSPGARSRSISPKSIETVTAPAFIPPSEKRSVHNIRSSDLQLAARTLRKTPQKEKMDPIKKVSEVFDKPDWKPATSLMSGLTKRLNFNQSKKDKPRKEVKTSKPKIEIRTYIEKHSKGNIEDKNVCHKKAKTKIDMFQKQIFNEPQTDNSSLSSEASRKSPKRTIQRVKVTTTKKLFEPVQVHAPPKPSFTFNPAAFSPSNVISGNVNEKIRKFSGSNIPEIRTPVKVPRRKKKGSFKRRSDRRKIYQMKKEIEEAL